MTKVLIFNPTIAPYRIDFFNAMNSSFNLSVCLQYRNLHDQHFDDYQAILDRCEFVPEYLSPAIRLGRRVIYKGVVAQIKKFQPDIVIGMEYGWEICAALLYRKLSGFKYKVVAMSDDSINMVRDDNDFTRIHKFMRRLVVPLLDDVILTSPEVMRWYDQRFGKGVHFPIISDETLAGKRYSDALTLSGEYIRSHHLAGKTVFLFVGRLVGLKRIEDILRAFKHADISDSALVVVGSGECLDNLKDVAGNDKRIIFTGRLEGRALTAWYNIATALVLASEREAFGAVTNEALNGGADVIISSNCGSSCLVKDGVNGYVFKTGDISALSRIMMKYSGTKVLAPLVPRKSKMTCSFNALFTDMVSKLMAL